MSARANILSRALLVAAALTAAAAPAAAQMAPWEQALYDGAKKEKEFTVYTAHYDTETIADVCAAFEKKYPGVKCNFVRTTAQVAFQRLQQDMKANLAVASVFSSTDISHYPELKKEGVLATYQPHNLAKMVDSLKQYNDKDSQYWVTAAALIVIAYNTTLVSEKDAPKSWTDLLDPKWKDKIAIGHPAFSGYVGTWTVEMRKLYGWQYFDKLEKNKPQIGRSINDTVTALVAGERQVAAGADGSTLFSAARGNPLAISYPSDGSVLIIAPSAIVKGAKHPNAAKLFMEYLNSVEASKINTKHFAVPLRPEVPAPPGAKPVSEVKTVRPTIAEIDKGVPEVIEQWRDTFGN